MRQRDAVDDKLHATARQGSALAGVAHFFAKLLIILFSLGALVALSGDALTHILTTGLTPASIPYAISAGVSTLLVACMDVAMIYAATKLRQLRIRRADTSELWGHVAILAVACVLEAATYVYMAGRYDPPQNALGWALVAARALAAPLFGVYLSMAAPLPVGPRDILYQAELAAGAGMIRDVTQAANNPDAPLVEKLALFGASAIMTDADRERLGHMIDVLTQGSQSERREALPAPDAIVEGSLETSESVSSYGEAAPDSQSLYPDHRGTGSRGMQGSGQVTTDQASQSQMGSRAKGGTLVRLRNDPRTREQNMAMGLGLLTVQPNLTQSQVRRLVGCSTETAQAIMATHRAALARNLDEAVGDE